MNVIQGTGRVGDFVLAGQDLATKEGFGHVSKTWYDKTQSYDECLELMEKDIDNREDIMGSLFDMTPTVNDDGKFVMQYKDGRQFELTEHARQQLASRIFMPTGVMKWLTQDQYKPNGSIRFKRDETDAKILTQNVKNGMRHVEADKEFRFRTYNNNSLRAVLTDQYATIDNRWYMDLIKQLIPDGRLSHWRGDADTIYGNVLIPDTIREEDDSDYGGMISLGNCEIGTRRISQKPSVFRAICMNGNIWDQTFGSVFSQVHRGKIDLFDLKKKIITNVNKQIPLMHDGIDMLLATMEFTVDDTKIVNAFAEIAKSNNFNKKEVVACVSQYNQFEKPNRNLFGIINAVTRAGQTLSNSRWEDFDMIGGELSNYNARDWDMFCKRADNITNKDLVKVYGDAVLAA